MVRGLVPPKGHGEGGVNRRAIVLILLAFAALYLAAVNNHWSVRRDSALYMGLGRSLAEGRAMEFDGSQWWGIPVGVPLLVAACRLVAGDQVWLINLVMTLLGLGVVALAWPMARALTEDLPDRWRTGLALGVLIVIGTSARLYMDSARVMTDVPFTFFVVLGLYAFIRGRRGHWAWCLAGALSMAVSTYIRLPGVAILGGALAAVLLDSRRPGYFGRALASAAGSLLVLAGFLVWLLVIRSWGNTSRFDYIESLRIERLFSVERLRAMGGVLADFPSAITSSITYQKLSALHFNLLPTAVVILGLVAAARRRQFIVVLPALAYVAMLTVRGGGSAASRYMLPMMPMMVYALLLGVETLAGWVRTRRGDEHVAARRPIALAATVAICALLSLPRIGREIYWMRQPSAEAFYKKYEHGQWKGYVDVSRTLQETGDIKADRVLTPSYTVVHYLSGLRTRENLTWEKKIYEKWTKAPPEALAATASEGDWRFVIVPADAGTWGDTACRQLVATGLFAEPPRRFDNLLLYDRKAPPIQSREAGASDNR